MKIRELMESQVRTCRADDSLATAGVAMGVEGCGVLPVVNAEKEVEGMISDRDICLAVTRQNLKPSKLRVRDAMRTDVHACGPQTDVRNALAEMRRWKVRRLPVIDDNDKLVGIVSLDEVVLQAKELVSDSFTGPLLTDVATTLRAICRHDLPAA